MSKVVDSQVNHTLILNLVSTDGKQKDSLHLAPFQRSTVIDTMYENSRDVINGLRTNKLSINHVATAVIHPVNAKSVDVALASPLVKEHK